MSFPASSNSDTGRRQNHPVFFYLSEAGMGLSVIRTRVATGWKEHKRTSALPKTEAIYLHFAAWVFYEPRSLVQEKLPVVLGSIPLCLCPAVAYVHRGDLPS